MRLEAQCQLKVSQKTMVREPKIPDEKIIGALEDNPFLFN